MARQNEYFAPTFDVAGSISRELESQLMNSNQPQEIGQNEAMLNVSNYDYRVDEYMRFMAETKPEKLIAPIDVIRDRAIGWYTINFINPDLRY